MTLWTSDEAEAATLGRASKAFTVNGLSIDTRTLQEGDLFVALQGDNRDGHDFVAAAFAAKAGAALVSRKPDNADGTLLTVAHTQRGLEDLARAARARSNAKILAVTGSAGKTTTKEILRLACNALGRTHASAASHNNHWGVPLSLAALPRDAQYGVFEIGINHFGEIRNLVSFVRPHVALITTIAPAHLEFFGNCEAIADAKSEIFEGIAGGGAALIPSDSPYADRLAARAEQAGVCWVMRFGKTGDAKLLSFTPDGDGMRVRADIMGRAVDCLIGAPGLHIAQNVVGALAAVALADGDVLNAAAALKTFTALKGRGARFDAAGITVIDESYNANPASMAAALALLTQASGRKIAVLGDMLEMGEGGLAYHAGLAAPIEANKIDLVFASGSRMKALWDALPASRRGAYAENSDGLKEPLAAALKSGDTVLVKGSHGSKMSLIVDALKAKAQLMLYYLSLLTHTDQLAFFRLFRYLSFRAVGVVMTALLIAFYFNPILIRWLKKKQGKGQPIRSDGPQRHIIEKAGTPTMGGVLILIPWIGSTLLWAQLSNPYIWIVLLVTVSFGLLGFLDDYYKVTKRTSDGLSSRARLAIEFAIAFLATWLIMQVEARSSTPGLSGSLAVPFIKTALLPLGMFFLVVGGFVIAGAANAVNFTDGLDGLAIMPVMIAAAAFILIVYLVGNERFAAYLQLPYVEYSGELVIFLAALIGAGLGFLWYNAPPAAIFMGDTGSLPLGGALGAVAVSVKHEIVLAIVGGLFVLETVSVIVQVVSFKLTGKRVFRMAPIHHHYEQLGWTEPTIVIRFWIVAEVLALLGLATLKLR